MSTFIGACVELQPGTVIIAGAGLHFVIIREVTEEEARQSYATTGQTLATVPGERFYEVESSVVPLGGSN